MPACQSGKLRPIQVADVLVYRGTSAGVIAAVEVASQGKKVILGLQKNTWEGYHPVDWVTPTLEIKR